MDSPAKKRQWTGAEKLRVLTEAHGLDEHALGALLRREGLDETELVAWETAAEAALSDRSGRAKGAAEARHILELERELRRKDAALLERAALLALKKKAEEIWGDGDDSAGPRRES